MKTIKGLILCIQFFTSIPVPYEVPMDKTYIERAIRMFPMLGLLQGMIYTLITYLLVEWSPLSTLAISFIIWLVWILVTGGLHLDGWMDVSDAYFSYRDPKRRLDIMKDSRVGAFGVLSVMILLSARFLFIFETIDRMTPIVYLFIFIIPFFGKIIVGMLIVTVKSAKSSGLGVMFQEAATKGTLFTYPVYLVFLFLISYFIWPHSFFMLIVFLFFTGIYIAIIRKKIVSWFGGMTGDVLGASIEGGETLLWMILWLLPYFVTD
ncbi:adenosylcobinamide-GDP ribazoletransferase [Bacillus andreraoultii]|uniref:adenosylcobinamide-GDP ribazoletransferase n=1 Tax=Bacillus andreraoultii TaxID=1499685 RepID=UPI00053A2B17|nr:adenosylcobinamide-GDP ribazoletransferase [Bacillus andreraoultii]